jgi:hypothetical protein
VDSYSHYKGEGPHEHVMKLRGLFLASTLMCTLCHGKYCIQLAIWFAVYSLHIRRLTMRIRLGVPTSDMG